MRTPRIGLSWIIGTPRNYGLPQVALRRLIEIEFVNCGSKISVAGMGASEMRVTTAIAQESHVRVITVQRRIFTVECVNYRFRNFA